jgi:hypothetical protein
MIATPRPKTWNEAIVDAGKHIEPSIPAQLLAKPTLVLLYCLFCPQRMDRDVILWLDRAFCRAWY